MGLYKVKKHGFTEDVELLVLADSEIQARVEAMNFENCTINDLSEAELIPVNGPLVINRKIIL